MFAVSIIFFVNIFYICYILISYNLVSFKSCRQVWIFETRLCKQRDLCIYLLDKSFWGNHHCVSIFANCDKKKLQFAALNHFFLSILGLEKLFARFKILLSQQLFCKLLLWTMFSKLLFRIIFLLQLQVFARYANCCFGLGWCRGLKLSGWS